MWLRLVLVLVVVAAACAGTDSGKIELQVAAAASLANPFAEIAAAFEARHEGVAVTLNLAASSQLREQILGDSGQDVFASASPEIMDDVAAAGGLAGPVTPFASNRLVLAVPFGNPGGVATVEDLADPNLLVGVCVEAAPCGRLAQELLALAGVEAAIDTFEPNARALRTKVEEGELDAALLYESDAAGSDLLSIVDLSAAASTSTSYVAAVIEGSQHSDEAQLFVDFLLSAESRRILGKYGFAPP